MQKFPFQIVLGSQSPRRKELLGLMNIDFRVEVQEVEESYPENLTPIQIAIHIASKKAKAFKGLSANELLITADTIVAQHQHILGKPKDAAHAKEMIQQLAGNTHEVITAVAFQYQSQLITFHDCTKVYMNPLSEAEINHYIENYKPYDKAGAYGIQEWIGLVAIQKIEGSYTNVMGLPTEKLYQALQKIKTIF
jgi:septum formation protein